MSPNFVCSYTDVGVGLSREITKYELSLPRKAVLLYEADVLTPLASGDPMRSDVHGRTKGLAG